VTHDIEMLHLEKKMSAATKLLTLSCLVLAVHVAGAQSSPSAIRGTLRENGAPITEATVFLQSLDDEKCAKLFTAKNQDRRLVEKLKLCVHDLSATSPDAAGNYQFAALKTGWYAVHFLWSIGKKPSESESLFKGGVGCHLCRLQRLYR
jgi:hypothetical protein